MTTVSLTLQTLMKNSGLGKDNAALADVCVVASRFVIITRLMGLLGHSHLILLIPSAISTPVLHCSRSPSGPHEKECRDQAKTYSIDST
jgi:hypothetical protein